MAVGLLPDGPYPGRVAARPKTEAASFHRENQMRNKIAAMLVSLAMALPSFAGTPVNVNKADAATLAKSLDGVGHSKAEAIVAWRDEHGPFKSVDDLAQVKGIGPATLERNRSAILLDDASGNGKAAKPAAPAKAKVAAKSSTE
ncbi:helix-hairpin-helix domain-containing protein [Dyella jiangningensis]|nr:helix-hairpin-helix domain-containing protein [Dyella jiangningensis]MDG2537270.1 helix-hairpin-helix domain-containing protein [Dyella jiangningensis]